jgi:lipopolysaccharide export system protein LptA
MRMDLAVQKISAGGGVSAQQGRGTVAGRTLQADLRARRAEVWGEAQLLRAPAPAGSPRRVRGPAPNGPQPPAAPPAEPGASEEISIKAGHLVLQWDPNAVAANGAVVVRQGPTVARAVRVAYTEASGRVDLSGAVTVEGFGEASAGGATLSADRVVVLLRERDIEASGSVTVHHQKQTAIANRGAYTGKTRRLVLTGRAQLQDEEGNVLRADAVTIDLEADTFEASGNVETIFKITRR